MKKFVVLALFTVFVVGCGSSNTPPPPKGPVAAQPGAGATGQWDPNTFQAAVTYCSAAGDPSFTIQQWATFCSCAYQAAATQWSFNDFATNFQAYYYTLQSQGVLTKCLQTAGMPPQQSQMATQALSAYYL